MYERGGTTRLWWLSGESCWKRYVFWTWLLPHSTAFYRLLMNGYFRHQVFIACSSVQMSGKHCVWLLKFWRYVIKSFVYLSSSIYTSDSFSSCLKKWCFRCHETRYQQSPLFFHSIIRCTTTSTQPLSLFMSHWVSKTLPWLVLRSWRSTSLLLETITFIFLGPVSTSTVDLTLLTETQFYIHHSEASGFDDEERTLEVKLERGARRWLSNETTQQRALREEHWYV